MTKETPHIIRHFYYSFNKRKVDEALLVISSNCKWANEWEGGYCFGHSELVKFWNRYWQKVNIYLYPMRVKISRESGLYEVDVVTVIRNTEGVFTEQSKKNHYFQVKHHLIKKFDIDQPGEMDQ